MPRLIYLRGKNNFSLLGPNKGLRIKKFVSKAISYIPDHNNLQYLFFSE